MYKEKYYKCLHIFSAELNPNCGIVHSDQTNNTCLYEFQNTIRTNAGFNELQF